MKSIKWKIIIVTCLVCLLPILLGITLWNQLPNEIAIHFNIHNEPDNFASKGFAVFALPCLMALMQMICCITTDINANKHQNPIKFEMIAKWILPVVSVLLQIVTLGYSLGWNIDIRGVACFIVGAMFLVLGNYLPKLNYIKNYNLDTEKARKINRFIGFETVIMGLLLIISIFLPPIYSFICLCLLIPYTIIGIIYGILVGRKSIKN